MCTRTIGKVTRRYTCHSRAPLCMILNAYWEPLDFELPPVDQVSGKLWRRWIDTALDAPYDIVPWQTAPALSGRTDRAAACSVVMLYTGLGD